jgi:hypothetical protein
VIKILLMSFILHVKQNDQIIGVNMQVVSYLLTKKGSGCKKNDEET